MYELFLRNVFGKKIRKDDIKMMKIDENKYKALIMELEFRLNENKKYKAEIDQLKNDLYQMATRYSAIETSFHGAQENAHMYENKFRMVVNLLNEYINKGVE